ncbi:hypothetical protein DMX10_04025 [Pseudomonas sp. 57B-090624]|nr:hypothetical protein DMX10_04025 [Pseudomonas sp. 57B-090624]
MQLAACSLQLAACSLQLAACSLQLAACSCCSNIHQFFLRGPGRFSRMSPLAAPAGARAPSSPASQNETFTPCLTTLLAGYNP